MIKVLLGQLLYWGGALIWVGFNGWESIQLIPAVGWGLISAAIVGIFARD